MDQTEYIDEAIGCDTVDDDMPWLGNLAVPIDQSSG